MYFSLHLPETLILGLPGAHYDVNPGNGISVLIVLLPEIQECENQKNTPYNYLCDFLSFTLKHKKVKSLQNTRMPTVYMSQKPNLT